MATKTELIKKIYIRLLNEETDVARPTEALLLCDGNYKVLTIPDYDPEDETWEFPPGSVVKCHYEMWYKGELLIAYELVKA